MQFYDQLIRDTEAARQTLVTTPVIGRALAGRVNLDEYVAFLTEAYHHVTHTVPLLMACGSRIPARLGWLRSAIAHYIEEEIGHDEWILGDIAACGADAEAVRNGQPSLPTELMVAYAYDTIQRGNPVGFFGMVHVLEGTSVALATQAAGTLQNALGLPKKAFTYLTTHGDLDQGHTQFFADLMNRLEDDGDKAAVIHCANVMYRLYGDIFRSLDSEPAAKGDAA